MSFGGGFAAGMGAGMGSGIAIGVSSGKKRAVSEIRDYIDRNGVNIVDRQGKPIKVDDFLVDAVGEKCCGSDSSANSKQSKPCAQC